jgi:glycosyltransferase involved in cell wall biosynthesis
MSQSPFEESAKVTVIVPTYNRCNDLKRCLDSLVHQTFANFEILVIDNGSTDETPKLLSNYSVRVIEDLTRNLTHVFNTGWRNSSGKIIAWITDDAEASPFWIENIIWEFEHHPNAILKFILSSLLSVPMLRDAGRGYREFPDRAWLIHPLACFLVLCVYATYAATNLKTTLEILGVSPSGNERQPNIRDRVILRAPSFAHRIRQRKSTISRNNRSRILLGRFMLKTRSGE